MRYKLSSFRQNTFRPQVPAGFHILLSFYFHTILHHVTTDGIKLLDIMKFGDLEIISGISPRRGYGTETSIF